MQNQERERLNTYAVQQLHTSSGERGVWREPRLAQKPCQAGAGVKRRGGGAKPRKLHQ